MPKLQDLTGKIFGRLTVIKRDGSNSKGRPTWLCACSCGEIVVAKGESLRGGITKSCGCLRREATGDRARRHGKTRTRLYNAWQNMKERCRNISNPYYGGRGICVCKEWQDSYEKFEAWALSAAYEDNLTIDRIDNNGGYSPENCRWVTHTVQMRNVRSNRLYKGKPISQLCEEQGLDYGYVRRRLNFYHDNESKFF